MKEQVKSYILWLIPTFFGYLMVILGILFNHNNIVRGVIISGLIGMVSCVLFRILLYRWYEDEK
jgi:hypothetical protein